MENIHIGNCEEKYYETRGAIITNSDALITAIDYLPQITCFEKGIGRCDKCDDSNINFCKSRQGCIKYKEQGIIRVK
jgi:hypothetical protein